nr:SCO family protein [Woeseia oceani]
MSHGQVTTRQGAGSICRYDSVYILSHSIRPTTDTREILQAYARDYGVISGKWHLLTGDKKAIYELAKDAYFANEDLGNPDKLSDFLHTENLLLIDQNRHIRGVYNGLSTTSVNHLLSDIEILQGATAGAD